MNTEPPAVRLQMEDQPRLPGYCTCSDCCPIKRPVLGRREHHNRGWVVDLALLVWKQSGRRFVGWRSKQPPRPNGSIDLKPYQHRID